MGNVVARERPGTASDGTKTFFGTLKAYFSDVSTYWNEQTQATYLAQYEEKLGPILEDLWGDRYPLHAFTGEMFETVLRELREEYHFMESTMEHYRYLLWIVYRAGFRHGDYLDQIFWGEVEDPTGKTEKEREADKVKWMRIRKAFNTEENILMALELTGTDPKTVAGETLGMALMYFEAMRNNEACGADFAALYQLKNYPEVGIISIYQTTKAKTSEQKPGGKTSNAPRQLPMLPEFYAYLMKRKAYLELLVQEGKLNLPEGVEDVDHLPIACVGTDYTRRATTVNVARAAREIFAKIGVGSSVYAELYRLLNTEEFQDKYFDEREPTAYLCRRNMATTLYHLGFSLTEIQYFMGHDIEEVSVTRNSFNDEDQLFSLWKKLCRHPIREILTHKNEPPTSLKTGEELLNLPSFHGVQQMKKDAAYALKICARETGDPLNLKLISENGTFKIKALETYEDAKKSEEINIISSMQQAYERKYKELKAAGKVPYIFQNSVRKFFLYPIL